LLALFLKLQLVADLFSLSSVVFFFSPSFNYILVYVFVINVAGSVFNKARLVDFRRCIIWSYGFCCFELRFMIVAVMTYCNLFFRCLNPPVWVLDLGWHHLSKFPFQITTDLSEESSITAHVLIVS
jgi:hypothetical protein